jgi:hypothetical protein
MAAMALSRSLKPTLPLLLAGLLLTACATPRWTNPQHPTADFGADDAACAKDAERVGRLSQLSPSGPNADMQGAANAQLARKQCLAAKGWQSGS